MKSSRIKRFCWKPDDLEHHGVLHEEAPVSVVPKIEHADLSQFKDHIKAINKDSTALSHLRKYKIHSDSLNEKLRKDKPIPEKHYEKSLASKEQVDSLDKITSHKLTSPMTVFRGAQGRHAPSAKKFKTVGHEFTDHGYTSTSTSPGMAAEFSEKEHVFAIHLKPGDKAHHFDAHPNSNSYESEIVLHRGTRFRVAGHSKISVKGVPHKVTHLHVVSQNPRKVKTDGSA